MNFQQQMEQLRGRQAAEWYQVMRSDETGDEERAKFAAWIAESSLNSAAYFRITVLARETREAAREAGLSGRALIEQLTPTVFPVSTPRETALSGGGVQKPLSRWRTISFAMAATALVAVALLISGELRVPSRYGTAAGEQKTVTLSDGSIVYLNAKSNVRVRMSKTAREIELEGEAFFQVAHDAQRPFRVHTDEAVVRAVGTAFNVSTRTDGTRVAVTEGKVQVTSESGESLHAVDQDAQLAPAAMALRAGEAARVSPNGAIERRPASEAATALAWREHLLVIDGMSLETAAQEFNKYERSIRFRVENVSPGAHHYSGTFYADDPESFADFLSHERDLSIERRGNEIVIRERK